jgi:HEPN domain-containing protein
MPPDPELVAECRAWLSRAAADLRAAGLLLEAAPPLLAEVAFHAQQAAEKALKAFLTWHQRPFRRTHSLEELGQRCLEIDAGLEAVVDRAVPLTEYAWRFRYPGEPEEPTRSEVEEAVLVARALAAAVAAALPPEVAA